MILQALIGEMRKTSGSVVFGGTMAYVPQTAWIRNALLRQNIVFGLEDDEDKCVLVAVASKIMATNYFIGAQVPPDQVSRECLSLSNTCMSTHCRDQLGITDPKSLKDVCKTHLENTGTWTAHIFPT